MKPLLLPLILNMVTATPRRSRIEAAVVSSENLNEGSSKFITKDNSRRIASSKKHGKQQTGAAIWRLAPEREGRGAVKGTKTEP